MFSSFLRPFLYNKYLLSQLIIRDIRSRYKQSIIGYAWIIFNPLVQLLVFSFVFSVVFRFPTNGVPYSIFLFIGLLPWIYLQTSLSTSVLVLVDNANLLKKVSFPREVLPYSVVFSKLVDLLFASSLVVIFMLYYHVPLHLTALYLIPLFFIQLTLVSGLALFLSVANLFYRDVQYVTNLVLLTWMYLTPIVYPLSLVPNQYIWIYKFNPMVGITEGYRSAVFNTPFDVGTITWSAIASLLIFIIGFSIFKKTEKTFADIV